MFKFGLFALLAVTAAALSGCVTTEMGVMPKSRQIVDIMSISGNGITPPATVVCIQGAGCQTGFGQSLATAAVQGVIGSAISAYAIDRAANVAAKGGGAASVNIVKVTATGGSSKAFGGNATNKNSSVMTN